MNGRWSQLVLVIAGAAFVLKAGADTNSWPGVPLYPSTSIPPLTQTKVASTDQAPPVENLSTAGKPLTDASSTSTRTWPATPLPPASSVTASPALVDPTKPVVKGTNDVATSAAPTGVPGLDDSHRLEPGDIVSFKIQEDEKNTFADRKVVVHLTVTDSSEVDFPYIGRVSVADKTCHDVAASVKALLEKDYYYQATVIIGLDSINKVRGQAFVSGLVRSPGPVDILFNHDLTAGEALLMMGGLEDFADKKQVKIIRNHNNGGTTNQQIIVVNMEDVLEKGKIDKDIILQPGDFVLVPARIINW